MRSGSTAWRAPLSLATPSTTIRRGPAPEMRAPIFLRQAGTSLISGSSAAFSITLVPLASVAAMIAVCVPPTVTLGKTISAPRNPFGARVLTPPRPVGERTRHDRRVRAADSDFGKDDLGAAQSVRRPRHHIAAV